MKNIIVIILGVVIMLGAMVNSSSYAVKYSEQFKAQQSVEDHPCLYSGDPNMHSTVVQLKSDPEKEGASADDCTAYIDILIEQGYKVFDVIPWGDDEYTWTLN